jgi:hypothetical protein
VKNCELYFWPIGGNSTETKPHREKQAETIVFWTRSFALHLMAAHLCLAPTFRDVDCPSKSRTRPSYNIFLLFRAEPLQHIERMLRKLDPISPLRIGHAMEHLTRGEETKPEVIQNSENCLPGE